MAKIIKLLVVDDSALVRNILSQGLAADVNIDVVGTAADAFIARDKIIELRPDVLTLDVEMPRMDGVEFLRRLMPQYPLPVVMVSSLTERGKRITLDALDAGAVDFVTKPSTNVAQGLDGMMMELRTKVKIAASANVSHWKNRKPSTPTAARASTKALEESTDKVVAIGASTGGTEAIRAVITQFPATTPGVVIVQHMPAGFTESFANRLNTLCQMSVKQADTGDRVMPGQVLIAPGDRHLTVRRSGGIYTVDCRHGENVCGHCPSVEVLFDSVAKHVGANAVGIMLTGMGHDGADAMVNMRNAGARTVAQDEATSVVFGMPKEAYIRGGAEKLMPLDSIADEALAMLTQRKPKPQTASA